MIDMTHVRHDSGIGASASPLLGSAALAADTFSLGARGVGAMAYIRRQSYPLKTSTTVEHLEPEPEPEPKPQPQPQPQP